MSSQNTNTQTIGQSKSWIQWCDDNLFAIPVIAFFIMVPLVMVGVAVALTKTVLFVKSLLV
ncbi:MAG: hypothetical protein DSZ03_03025 [Sulfurimonas sp.]|nr:MAG: hypothetical protein DSZ03_03025 [Sulfurimonas sp.]